MLEDPGFGSHPECHFLEALISLPSDNGQQSLVLEHYCTLSYLVSVESTKFIKKYN